MYIIRIDAIIIKQRWDDQTDEEFLINEDWSIELETEDKKAIDKLQDLKTKSNFNSYELPDFVNHHLQTSNEISFDECTDKILKISSFYGNIAKPLL